MEITATFIFTGAYYTLAVNTVANGDVSAAPDLIEYQAGASVQLTAAPDTGWNFAGWTGDAGGADNPLAVVMDSDKVITATFTEEVPVVVTSAVTTSGAAPDLQCHY